jgi:hypothetical protein
VVDKLLPWEQFFEALPIFPRVLVFVAIALFVWIAAAITESCAMRMNRRLA